jgi:uncharacterized OsmC-like protein
MSLTARSRSIPGTLRQEIVITANTRLITDEPECIGGEGSAPSTHELLPAALAACISTPSSSTLDRKTGSSTKSPSTSTRPPRHTTHRGRRDPHHRRPHR